MNRVILTVHCTSKVCHYMLTHCCKMDPVTFHCLLHVVFRELQFNIRLFKKNHCLCSREPDY